MQYFIRVIQYVVEGLISIMNLILDPILVLQTPAFGVGAAIACVFVLLLMSIIYFMHKSLSKMKNDIIFFEKRQENMTRYGKAKDQLAETKSNREEKNFLELVDLLALPNFVKIPVLESELEIELEVSTTDNNGSRFILFKPKSGG